MEDGERYAPKTLGQLQINADSAGNAIIALFHAVNAGTAGNGDSPLVLTYNYSQVENRRRHLQSATGSLVAVTAGLSVLS